MEATPGEQFVATATDFTTGLVGTIGVRLLAAPSGLTVIPRQTAGITELIAGSGTYAVQMMAPPSTGFYTIYWDNGSGLVATEDLEVEAGPSPFAPVPLVVSPVPAVQGVPTGGIGINKLLVHRVDIYRYITIGYDEGTPVVDPNPIYSSVPCRLDSIQSRRRDMDLRTKIEQLHLNYAIIFFMANQDLQQSDLLIFPNQEQFRIEDIDLAVGYSKTHHLEATAVRVKGAA